MKRTVILATTILTTLAVTGVMTSAGSFAAPLSGTAAMDRIGHGGSTYDTAHGMALGGDSCTLLNSTGTKVDVIERIGHGGSTYTSSRLTPDKEVHCTGLEASVSNEERIGHGGSIYPYGQTMKN